MVDAINDLKDALFPYGGADTNPFMWMRTGIVVKVYASAEDCGSDKDPNRYVGTVEIEWLDRMAPRSQLVPWTFPAISNPTIATSESATSSTNTSTETSQSSTGSSCGIFFSPSVNDVVICGYRNQMNPVILGFLPMNLYRQQTGREASFGTVRTMRPGEYAVKSQQQAEVYLDRAGSMQLVVKQQPAGSGNPPVDTSSVPSTELARISLGVTYDSTFSTPIKSAYGQNVVCNIQLSNGAKFQIDNAGNLDVSVPGKMSHTATGTYDIQTFASFHAGATSGINMGTSGAFGLGGNTLALSGPNGVTVGGNSVNINSGTKGSARLDDQTLSNSSTDPAFWSWWANLPTSITALPVTPLDGGATLKAGLATLFGTAPTSQTGKISSSSSSVKVGD